MSTHGYDDPMMLEKIKDLEAEVKRLEGLLDRIGEDYEASVSRVPDDSFYPVAAWSNGSRLIVTGDPPDEDDDPGPHSHNCDVMGCGSLDHVILSGDVDGKPDRSYFHLAFKRLLEKMKGD